MLRWSHDPAVGPCDPSYPRLSGAGLSCSGAAGELAAASMTAHLLMSCTARLRGTRRGSAAAGGLILRMAGTVRGPAQTVKGVLFCRPRPRITTEEAVSAEHVVSEDLQTDHGTGPGARSN